MTPNTIDPASGGNFQSAPTAVDPNTKKAREQQRQIDDADSYRRWLRFRELLAERGLPRIVEEYHQLLADCREPTP